MNNFEDALKKIEECQKHRPRMICCVGPTGPTGPTGPSSGATGATDTYDYFYKNIFLFINKKIIAFSYYYFYFTYPLLNYK